MFRHDMSQPPHAFRSPLWTWDSRCAAGLSAEQRLWVSVIDEVKPVIFNGAACLLATASSTGGIVLIRVEDQHILFCAPLRNAHSAELLPGGWIVAAGSTGSDCLVLHAVEESIGPVRPIAQLPFPAAHGTVWDRGRECLWACGGDYLSRIKCTGNSLVAEARIHLPEGQAHDLSPNPMDKTVVVTTGGGAWQFDPDAAELRPFAPLARMAHIKSISIDAASGTLAYQKGEAGNWWSETIHLLWPDGCTESRHLPGVKLYKARWDQLHQL